jgi:hypothetical protein
MGTPRLNLSKFTKAQPKGERTLGDYAAMVIRGASGFAPGGLIGAGVGALGEGLAQTVENREDYNFPQIGTQAGLGLIPFGKVGGIVRGAAKGGLMSGAGNAATALAEGEEIDPTSLAISTGLGAATGGFLGKLKLEKFIGKGKTPEAAKFTSTPPKTEGNIRFSSKAEADAAQPIMGPLAKPLTPPVPKEGVKVEPNQPHIKLDMRTRPKNPLILSSDREAGRKIMNQILEESARAKAAKLADDVPKVDLQVPKDVSTGSSREPSTIISLLNIPKATAASTDLSAPLRQGIFLIGRKAWWNAWKPMVQSLREGKYNEINKAIVSHPKYTEAAENGLMVTTLEGLQKREEAFASQIADKIPIVGKYLIKPSERAYVTFLNKLRMDLYGDLADKAQRLNAPVDKKMLANYINAATGRGTMGLTVGGKSQTLEQGAHLLNTVFFSPRFIASRVQLLNPVSYVKMDPFTRKEALRDLATLTGVAGTVLGLSKLNGAQVTEDTNDPDFGKIKNGDVRVDILGGFGQYIRFFSQVARGLTTEKEGPNPWRFIESKLSPSARLAKELISQKDYFGRDISIPKSVINTFTPMITKDIYDLYKEDPDLVPLAGLSAFGIPVQSYGERKTGATPTGIPRVKLNLSKFKVR